MIFSFDLLCVACLFGAFFPLFRFAVRLEFFDRPLALALFWNFFFPNPANIAIAVFYELLWLDLLVIGTYVPPQAGLATLVCLVIVAGLEISSSVYIAPLLFLVLPFAYLASFLERQQRKWQNREATELMHAARSHNPLDFQPQKVIVRFLLIALVRNLLVFLISLYVCVVLFRCIADFFSSFVFLSWPVLWFIASIPSVLSIRMMKGYALLSFLFFLGVIFLVLRSFFSL